MLHHPPGRPVGAAVVSIDNTFYREHIQCTPAVSETRAGEAEGWAEADADLEPACDEGAVCRAAAAAVGFAPEAPRECRQKGKSGRGGGKHNKFTQKY